MVLFAKKKVFENRQKNRQKTDKNRQKPILIFGPQAQPTKTDSEKGRRFTSQVKSPKFLRDSHQRVRWMKNEHSTRRYFFHIP